MSTISAVNLEGIATTLSHLNNVNYIRVGTLALAVYENLLTFNLEIDFVWKKRWSSMKILFILTRYLPFFDITASIALPFLNRATVAECNALYASLTWVLFVGMAIAEAVLTMRTWAVCNSGTNKKLGVGLSVFFIVALGSQFVPIYLFWRSIEFVTIPGNLHLNGTGCIPTSGKSSLLVINWGILVLYDGVNMVLMLSPAYELFKQPNCFSKLSQVVLHDGFVYYCYIFVMALANVIVLSSLSEDYSTIILILARVMHSIFACRVILHAREVDYKTQFVNVASSEVTVC